MRENMYSFVLVWSGRSLDRRVPGHTQSAPSRLGDFSVAGRASTTLLGWTSSNLCPVHSDRVSRDGKRELDQSPKPPNAREMSTQSMFVVVVIHTTWWGSARCPFRRSPDGWPLDWSTKGLQGSQLF